MPGRLDCPLSVNRNQQRKWKDRREAVSPKTNQALRSSGGNGLPLPAPVQQTQRAEAGGEEWRSGWVGCDSFGVYSKKQAARSNHSAIIRSAPRPVWISAYLAGRLRYTP